MEKYFDEILEEYRDRGVEDIFFTEDDNIHLRILGEIVRDDRTVDKRFMDFLDFKFKNTEMVREAISSFDFDVSYESSVGKRYRLNLFRSLDKRKSVIRIIASKIKSFEDLGVPALLYNRIVEKKGFSIIAGKTCSGKSTTVAAIIERILKTRPWHIISLEDPVEFKFKNSMGIITQRELKRDFDSFPSGIVSSLRQSPDLIFIGEIRNRETLKAALTAAESGTGIISTLHSKGGSQSIMRMLSMFDSSDENLILFQLSSYLNFINSQVLIKRGDKMELDYELLLNSTAVSNSIREGKLSALDNLIFLGQKQGMRKFRY